MRQIPLGRNARGNESTSRLSRRQRSRSLSTPRADSRLVCNELSLAHEPACNAAAARHDPDGLRQIGTPNQILLRRLDDGDSLEQLTEMLHRAFFRVGAMGIPCSCVSQSPEVTRQRISHGDCFVALLGDLIVGTITLYAPDPVSDSQHYRDARVGTLRQLAVDPLFHGQGIGSALLRLAEDWAMHHGYSWLALDTPETADHLIDYYQHQGFNIKETLQFADRPYQSVVFSKSVADRSPRKHRPACMWWISVDRASPIARNDKWLRNTMAMTASHGRDPPRASGFPCGKNMLHRTVTKAHRR